MKILIVVAHLDDETFGLGGFLSKINPEDVTILSLCRGRDEENCSNRIQSFNNVIEKLGIKSYLISKYFDMELDEVNLTELSSFIERFIELNKPEIVITNCENDLHQDHQKVSKAVKIACRPNRNTSVKELYEFKIKDSQVYDYTYFDTIINIDIDKKRELCSLYTSEKQPELENKEYLKTIFRIL